MELHIRMHMNAHANACSVAIYVTPYIVLIACCTRCTLYDSLFHQFDWVRGIGHEHDQFDVMSLSL